MLLGLYNLLECYQVQPLLITTEFIIEHNHKQGYLKYPRTEIPSVVYMRKKARVKRAFITIEMHVHYTCISLSYLGRCCVHSIRISYWFLCSCPVTVLPNLVGWGDLNPRPKLLHTFGGSWFCYIILTYHAHN